jgi:hypothetical protein
LQLNSIIAIAPSRKNALPWFGKVFKIHLNNTVDVLWFHKHNDSIYYFLNKKPDNVHYDAIICNGIEFEPNYNETLQWRLLTPISFIQALNSDNIPILRNLLHTPNPYKPNQAAFNITNLVFKNKE